MSTIELKQISQNPEHSNVLDVSPDEVLAHQNELTLIDVRRPDEYTGELGHIANSTLITLDFLPQKLNEIPKDKTVVFICRSGNRSGHACTFAKDNGYEHVYNMLGGMIAWNEKQFVTEGKSEA